MLLVSLFFSLKKLVSKIYFLMFSRGIERDQLHGMGQGGKLTQVWSNVCYLAGENASYVFTVTHYSVRDWETIWGNEELCLRKWFEKVIC